MLKAFKRDRDFLLRYYALSTVVSLLALGALWQWHPVDFRPSIAVWLVALIPLVFPSFTALAVGNAITAVLVVAFQSDRLSLYHLALVPLGIYWGMVMVPIIHNCAHGNFRPRWLNRVLGELCSLHLLSGFPGFVILHLLHHQHADDPQRDPHPNHDRTYWQFLNGLKRSLGAAFWRLYVAHWGDTPESRARWRRMRLLLSVNRVLRALLILFLFGPIGFVFFYVPSILANQLTYAHINYYTHQLQPDGSARILDLNHGFYRVLNRMLQGIYFHGTHHRHCGRFNPARGAHAR